MEQFYEWGDRSNPSIVFLHGMGGTGLSFGELAVYLSDKFHVVSFNLPGHGGESALTDEREYRPTQLAQRIKKHLEVLDQPELYLAGHSWGAHLALYFAAIFPTSIRGVILLDGGYFQEDPEGQTQDQVLESVEAFVKSFRFPSWNDFIETEKAGHSRWTKELEIASMAQVIEVDSEIRLAVSSDTAKAIIKGISLEPTSEILGRVDCPVLLIRSTLPVELESIRKDAIVQFKKDIRNVAVQEISETSHNIYYDAPLQVSERVDEWIYRFK